MAARDLDICIVGAGMSGLLMGIVLQKAGIERFRIYEKADSVGGTWRVAIVEVPPHLFELGGGLAGESRNLR